MADQQDKNIIESLEAEFSPPLDTSLISAMASDYMKEDGNISTDALQDLRRFLSELATQAEQDESALVSQLATDLQISPTEDASGNAYDIFSTSENASMPCTAMTSIVSSGSDNSRQCVSPLQFLKAAFPHLPPDRLRSALGSSEDADEVDMEAVVGDILSMEYVRELEERGLEDEAEQSTEPWATAKTPKPKGKKKNGKTITLGDIRQQQHVRRPSTTPASPQGAPVDPWTQVMSIASRLADLLPSKTPAYFQSLFHSPKFPSPSVALRHALTSLKPSPGSSDIAEIPEENQLIVNLFELKTSDASCPEMSDFERQQLLEDITLAVEATAPRRSKDDIAEAALELVNLLTELDSGNIEWSVYHSPTTVPSTRSSSHSAHTKPSHRSALPTGPFSPPTFRPRASTSSSASSSITPSPVIPDAWQTIPVIPRDPVVNPHAEFIPAYNFAAKVGKGKKARKISAPTEKKLDVMDPYWHRKRASELIQKRNEALLEASRAWQRGNAKNRGGEVALTFAERAREFQEQAKEESLDAAWDMVHEKRISSSTGTTIDLHGTTVNEAIYIVLHALSEEPPTSAKPLKIITGRGNHSANRVGVLGPAIHAALLEEGWNVSKWDGGLVVRDRT